MVYWIWNALWIYIMAVSLNDGFHAQLTLLCMSFPAAADLSVVILMAFLIIRLIYRLVFVF